MNIKLVQIDGKLPNLALMRLSSYYKENNDDVYFTRHITPELFENPYYDKVFASSIFGFSRDRIERLKIQYPNAIIGGTGTDNWTTKIEDHIGDYFKYDYSIYPDFEHSIGFTQRGCRLKCKFCVVPTKEGKNRSTSSIYDIWRGDGHPKKIHLLDNDFFGQPEEQWKERIKEIKEGKFKVCFNQGINIRLIDETVAKNLLDKELQIDQQYKDFTESIKELGTWHNNYQTELENILGRRYNLDNAEYQVRKDTHTQKLDEIQATVDSMLTGDSSDTGFKSVKSVGSGNIINIAKTAENSDNYVININNKCLKTAQNLSTADTLNGKGYELNNCDAGDSTQYFIVNEINNKNDYENLISQDQTETNKKVPNDEPFIQYPFSVITPEGDSNKGWCLDIDDYKNITIQSCKSSPYQRFKPSMTEYIHNSCDNI